MTFDASTSLKRILSAYDINPATPRPKLKPVVTLSRDEGTLGDEIAAILAEKLEVEVFDKQILDKIAARAGIDPGLMQELDEKVGKSRHLWLFAFIENINLTHDEYRRHLLNVVTGILRTGGIIIGRGAHLILAKSRALRVRITGSEAICAERIAETRGISTAEARRIFNQVGRERGRFIWEHFHQRLNDPTTFDLVINTDRITNPTEVADTIAAALELCNLQQHASDHPKP